MKNHNRTILKVINSPNLHRANGDIFREKKRKFQMKFPTECSNYERQSPATMYPFRRQPDHATLQSYDCAQSLESRCHQFFRERFLA